MQASTLLKIAGRIRPLSPAATAEPMPYEDANGFYAAWKISDGQERLWRGVWWELTGATVFMFVLVLALNLLGDALRDALDPKLRTRE